MTRGVRTAAIAAILLLTLTACRNGEARGRNPLPPLTASAATPAATSPAPIGSPTRSKAVDPKAEVEAFVREYFEATNVASTSGNTLPWRAMMTDDCTCRESATDIEQAFEVGSIRGLSWTLRAVLVRGVSGLDAKVTVTYDISAHDDLDRDGDVRVHNPAYRNARDAMTLTKVRGRWLVSHVAIVRKGETP
jgi:hypothetical protein